MHSNNILVTGFGPFGEHKVNASWEAVSALPDEINDFKIIKKQIPVVYSHVQTSIPQLWIEYNPKLVIHVGVSSYTNQIKIETRANKQGYERKDINGTCPESGKANCEVDVGECINTNLCVETISNRLNESSKLKASISDDAGRYLCEFIYYTSLKIDKDRALFVHVPPLDQPFTKYELAKGLEEIITCSLNLVLKNEQKCACFPSTIYKNGRAAAAF